MIYSITSVLPNRIMPGTQEPMSIKLDMFNPFVNGLAIISVTNTGPLKANTVMDDWATVPGGKKNTDHISYRNIVMKLQYVGNASIEEIRHLTYKYFPVREDVRLEFTTDSGTYYINGHIDDNAVPMWTKEEMSTISIYCGDPFFYDIQEKRYDFETIVPLFNFFFPSDRISMKVNDTWIKFQKQPFPMSKKIRMQEITVNNPSDQYIGLRIDFTATGTVINPRFVNLTTNEGIYLNGEFDAGDEYIIDTRPGHKSITKSDGTNAISKYVVKDSTGKKSKWILLQPGDNKIKYDATSGAASMDVSLNVRPLYEGI